MCFSPADTLDTQDQAKSRLQEPPRSGELLVMTNCEGEFITKGGKDRERLVLWTPRLTGGISRCPVPVKKGWVGGGEDDDQKQD